MCFPPRVSVDMELGRVPADLYAGYIEDDSDLEYSGAEEYSNDDSSDDACTGKIGSLRAAEGRDEEEEDEFEREMDSEVMGLLALISSPSALRAAVMKESASRPRKQREEIERGRRRQQSSVAKKAGAAPVEHEGRASAGCVSTAPTSVHGGRVRPEGEEREEGGSQRGRPAERKQAEEEYYDEVYFDSSSNEEEGEGEGEGEGGGVVRDEEVVSDGGGRRKRRERRKIRKLTNDELFYDPNMDDEDEKWVARQRMAYHNVKVSQNLQHQKQQSSRSTTGQDSSSSSQPSSSGTAAQSSSVPRSDAILSCPACMHTLCIDCQRHMSYANQYRAMFVMNCLIAKGEVLRCVPTAGKKERKRRRSVHTSREEGGSAGGMEERSTAEDLFHPVRCSECNTEVAVIDKDEVFHFFNVLASAP